MIADFLRAVWGPQPLGSYGEIRTIEPGEGKPLIAQHYELLQGPDWWEFAADRVRSVAAERGRDVYYGVLPRLRKAGTAADVDDLTRILWADVDAKKVSDVLELGKHAALAAINAFPIPPQILVDSGGGWHAYWRLDRPVPYALARPVMIWIANALKGDKVHDKSRILRVPGTFNWKRGEPVAARLVRFDLTREYPFTNFEGIMPIERERHFRPADRTRITNLPDWLDELVQTGAPQGQRSETAFRAILWLLRYGRTPNEIREIFRSTPEGIGEKYAEKPTWDADRWLDSTIRAAEAQA